MSVYVYVCLTGFLEQRRHKLHSPRSELEEDVGVGLEDGLDHVEVQEVDELALGKLDVNLEWDWLLLRQHFTIERP